MRQRAGLGACAACAMLLAACGGSTGAHDQQAQGNSAAANNPLLNSDTRPQPITVTGCLTESDHRFVLTSLDQRAATPTTETYQLKGATDAELAKYTNREVRIAGEADAPRVADVQDLSAPPIGTSGDTAAGHSGTGKQGAEVRTQQSTRFEVRTLTVSSVTPTGNACTTPAAPSNTSR